MSYLGRGLDKISNIEILDNITFDGSSSYSITKSSVAFVPNSAQSLLISIDGVVQATNFSVSTSTIDFGVAVPSTSTCNFFLHYGTGVLFTPADGTVTEAKIGSGAVTSAKLSYPLTTFSSTGIDDNATSTAITIDSSEQVGIGTTSLQPFLVNGARGSGMGSYPTWETTTGRNLALFETDQSEGTFVLGSPTNGYAQLGFADPSHKSSGRIGYDHSADAMVFGTNSGAERMRIQSNGRITTFGQSTDYGSLNLLGEGGASYKAIVFSHSGGGGEVGSISTTASSTAYNTSSDYRLKENVSYDFDATTRLKQLRPARFNFIADADTTVDGFLAHEVSSVVPEAISGEKDATETKEKVVVNANGQVIAQNIEQADWEAGKIADEDGNTQYPTDSTWEATKVVPVYQGIDQSKLVPLLVKTIQELEARITQLENA